jgi:hypothetical protein
MYMSRMVSVGKAENGFVVECCVPIKPQKKKEAEELMVCCEGSREKQYIAKDAAEVGALIAKLMPMLEEDYTNEKDFDAAFDKAAM